MGKDRFITYMQDQYPAQWGDGHCLKKRIRLWIH